MSSGMPDPANLFDIRGRVALITGATGAFGQVAAEALGRMGAKLVLAAGNSEALKDVAERLSALDIDIAIVNRRPNTADDCNEIVNIAKEKFSGVDILVVASGMNDVDLIQNMSVERWQKVMDANVLGTWLMCRSVGQHFLEEEKRGKVVLVSSARGKLGHPAGYTAYCPSKSAVDGLTRSLACEWGKYGITVNAIAPTVFRSNLTAWMFEDKEPGKSTREGMLSRIPLGRLGEPEDLAGPLIYLSSAASNFCTGQVIYADGGYTAG